MKKGILLLLSFLSLGFIAQAQTISKSDTKNVTREINKNIEKIEVAIGNTDWKELQKVVDKTAVSIEENAGNFIKVIEEIDFSKLVGALSKMAEEIEENIDTKKLEQAVEKIGSRIENVVIEIDRSDSQK